MIKNLRLSPSQILLYTSVDGETKVEVKLENETVWLVQTQMAELFQTTKQNISLHLKNIFSEKELEEVSVVKDSLTTASDGKKYKTTYYNLDAIISIGYRVNSVRGTQFRIWATRQLREYLIKGFVMNDQRLAEGKTINGINYFDELLERVRAIRASEKNLYQKVRDIFSTSIDYCFGAGQAKEFYSTVQNKFHFAVTGETAAELVVHRVSASQPNLGMTNWKNKTPKSEDAKIAKNYMVKDELEILYLLVEQFLSFAELQIKLRRPMYMKDWREYLDNFLKLNKLEILKTKGSVSHREMERVVSLELKRYQKLINENIMTNHDFLKKYLELQSGIMSDELIDVGFGLLDYCINDSSSFWNNILINQSLTGGQLSEIEERFKKFSRNPAVYFENKPELESLKKFLANSGYKKTSEVSWMFYEKKIVNQNDFGSVKKVVSKEDLETFLRIFDACYQKDDPKNPYGELGEYLGVAKDAWIKFQGTNRLEYFMLYKDNEPVAVSTLTNHNRVGYISNVGSLQKVRGEGYGKRATLFCVWRSQEQGNTVHCLATEEGTNPNGFYKKLGFETRFTALLYTKG